MEKQQEKTGFRLTRLLKSGGSAVIDCLAELLEEVWRTRQVPQEWKDATLVPLHEKKDKKICDNYCGVALLSVPGKVLALTLLERLQTIIEAQCGFRTERGTVDQISVVWQVVERPKEYHTPVCMSFVDLNKSVQLSELAGPHCNLEGIWTAPGTG